MLQRIDRAGDYAVPEIDRVANRICDLARVASLPHWRKLDRYLEANSNVGIEKWFQVELTVKLLEKQYKVKISQPVPVDGRKRKPDLTIERNEVRFVLELKAGALWRETSKIQKDADKFPDCTNFLGCLFLGRFVESRHRIESK